MAENPNTHPEIEARLAELSLRLSRTKGKKVYGYLKRDIKDLIDEIVDLLAEDENIAKLYDLWYEKSMKPCVPIPPRCRRKFHCRRTKNSNPSRTISYGKQCG